MTTVVVVTMAVTMVAAVTSKFGGMVASVLRDFESRDIFGRSQRRGCASPGS